MKIDSDDIGKTDGATFKQRTEIEGVKRFRYGPKVPGEFVSLSDRKAIGLASEAHEFLCEISIQSEAKNS